MANMMVIDDAERNAQEWPFGGYATLPTSALPELPPFHYETVVVDGRITQRTTWSEVPEITKMLQAYHWRIIDDYPQIGSFLRLNGKGKFKASVFHSLMLRLCLRLPDKRKSRYEYWFLIKGKPVIFGVEEFSLVSGLRFGRLSDADSQTIDEGGNLKNRYFSQWGEMHVPVDAVRTKISSMVSRNANPETVCKLVFSWVISALMLPILPIKEVPNSVLAVCDDLAICERYPWGEKLWSVTIDELMEHMCSDRRMTSGDRIRRWNAGGFPHILLYWMLEAIEGMPDAANCYPRQDPALPRTFFGNWTGSLGMWGAVIGPTVMTWTGSLGMFRL